MVWEAELPLFGPIMQRQWTVGMLATALIMAVILGTIMAAQGEWKALPPLLAMTGVITLGLWLLGIVVMAVLFRGRYRVRYTLSADGLRCDTIDRVAKGANRLAIGLGILTGKQQLLGTGLIGISRESEAVRWSGAFTIRPQPSRHTLLLRNGWRNLLWVQCTPENYARVAALTTQYMKDRRTESRAAAKSPVPAYLGRTALAVIACVPLFPLAREYHISLLLPIVVLCFALAMVWMINLFAWVVLGGLAAQVVLVVIAQFEQRKSFFNPGTTYRAFEMLSGDDFSLFVVSGIGIAILTWLCLGALRGRWLAALVADHADMDGG